MREQAVANGRSANDLKIFSVISIVVAPTDQEAEEKLADYVQYGSHEGALALLSGWTGFDFSTLDPDATVEQTKSDAIQSVLEAHGFSTVREWSTNLVVGGVGHVLAGSPKTIADQMQNWFEVSGVDGFNLARTVTPECYEDFVNLVVPELQQRGVYKRSYQEGSFREKLFGKSGRLSKPHPAAEYRR